MTTNPPGNDSGTPIHDRTAASDGHEVRPGVTVPSFASGVPAAGPSNPDVAQAYDPYGDDAEVRFNAPLDAVPADAGSGTADAESGKADAESGKADAAKGAAQDVAGDAKAKAADVAGTAKEQASKVASEATDHAKQLYGQASENLKQQAGEQQERAAGGLRSLGEQLGRMAENDEDQGVAAKVVRDLSGRATSAAGFLENRDPGSLLDEVKTFAAKRPGTFIAIAAGAGILAGRLTKALAADAKHEKEAGNGPTSTHTGTGPGGAL